MASSGRFVCGGDYGRYVISFADKAVKRFDSKIGCAEKYDFQIFFCQNNSFFYWLSPFLIAASSSFHRRSSGTGAVRSIVSPETG